MNRFQTVQGLMASTFNIDPARITASTMQKEIVEWDSVGHLNLMLSLEETFGVRMDVEDMVALTSVQSILDFVEQKCGS